MTSYDLITANDYIGVLVVCHTNGRLSIVDFKSKKRRVEQCFLLALEVHGVGDCVLN